MSLLVRALLVWLLAIAIPVQGAVAAAMRCCGSGHHQSQSVSTADHRHDNDHDESAGHHKDGGHDHGAPADVADPSIASGTAQDAGHHDASLKADKCSACSSCGTAAGLPSTPAVLQVGPFNDVLVAFVATPPLDFITSGPQRPPRSLLV